MDAIGAHHFWGFSPALDLQQLVRTVYGAGFLADAAASTAATSSGRYPASGGPAPEGGAHANASGHEAIGAGTREQEPLCILLLQPGDPRHIIKTIAQRYRHETRPLHVRAVSGTWREHRLLSTAQRIRRRNREVRSLRLPPLHSHDPVPR
jgi:hypothetical protein